MTSLELLFFLSFLRPHFLFLLFFFSFLRLHFHFLLFLRVLLAHQASPLSYALAPFTSLPLLEALHSRAASNSSAF